MILDEYQKEAMSLRLSTATHEYAVLGLSGEVGELHSALAKSVRDGTPISREALKKELGDILWFIAALSTDFGFPFSDVATTNIEKLKSRQLRGMLMGSGDDR